MNVVKDSRHFEESIIVACADKFSAPSVALIKYRGKLWDALV